MANEYTVKIAAVCAGGEHITLQLYRDAAPVKKIQITKTEALDADVELQDAVIVLCRQAIKSAGATTPAQMKAAIEGMVITL